MTAEENLERLSSGDLKLTFDYSFTKVHLENYFKGILANQQQSKQCEAFGVFITKLIKWLISLLA